MDLDLKPGTRILVYTDRSDDSPLVHATVVRVNKRSITIETEAGRRTIPPAAIADMAPGTRDRLHRESVNRKT